MTCLKERDGGKACNGKTRFVGEEESDDCLTLRLHWQTAVICAGQKLPSCRFSGALPLCQGGVGDETQNGPENQH